MQALMIAVIGVALLNITFMFDFAWQSAVKFVFLRNIDLGNSWFPLYMHLLFVLLIAIISWLVYRMHLGDIYKATYTMVPAAVLLVTDGILFYRWPIYAYSVGVIASLIILYVFYQKKLSWFYYFAVLFVALVLLVMGLTGQQI